MRRATGGGGWRRCAARPTNPDRLGGEPLPARASLLDKGEENAMSESRKLTGREAINRVLWDARLNQAAFTVGYADRVDKTVRELPLPRWTGDIPSHRIVHLRCAGEIVWSRSAPTDHLADARLPGEAWAAPVGEPSSAAESLRDLPVYRFRDGEWARIEPAPSTVECENLVVATWNVLGET